MASCIEPEPLTVEWLLPHLLPYASKWSDLGKALSIDENQLITICNRTARDDDSLKEMLTLYMARSNRNWNEIEDAMKKIKPSELQNNKEASSYFFMST